jgi:uncharacterized protein (DUF849 family)
MQMEKLIIQVRVNEGTMRDVSPHVPYSPEEIAQQSLDCWRNGAAMVHYHARDPQTGAKSSEVDLYAEVVRRIKKDSDMITFPTLGAALLPTPEARMAHILTMAKDPATKPDCIPVDMLSTNLDRYDSGRKDFTGSGDLLYLNTANTLKKICQLSQGAGVMPVSMMWNVPGVRLTEAFIEMGLFSDPLLCELPLFGDNLRGYGHPGTIKGLMSLLDFFPQGSNWIWMANALGTNAFPVLAAAMALGGHVVVGVADDPYEGLGYPTNAELVSHVVELARYMGREVATAAEARQMLGLA